METRTSAAGGVSSQRIASASSRPAHNALSSQICWLVRFRACQGRSSAEINIPAHPAYSNGAP